MLKAVTRRRKGLEIFEMDEKKKKKRTRGLC